jgi:hypothetical protein
MSYANHQLFESLEDRRLFSGAAVGLDTLPTMGPDGSAGIEMPLNRNQDSGVGSQPIRRQATPSQTNWLLGNWRGAIKVDLIFTSMKVKFTMKVTGATDKSISGSITVDGYTFKGKLPFKGNGSNQFSMKYSHGDYSGSIKGTVDPAAGKISGKISGEADGMPFFGKIALAKQ